MKIISDFKDYYDTACVYGIDPSIKYVRKSVIEDVDMRRTGSDSYSSELAEKIREAMQLFLDIPSSVNLSGYKFGTNDWGKVLIGFCGKLYPAVEVNGKFFYDYDSFLSAAIEYIRKVIEPNNSRKEENFLKSIEEKFDPKYPWRNNVFSKDRWNTVKEKCNQPFHDLFIKAGCPIFSITKEVFNAQYIRTITINPKLSDYNFFSVVPANEAFQNISMYLGNELATQIDPTDTIPDDVKIHKHGFDKTSFRKQSTKKG